MIALVFSTKVERERPDIELQSNIQACLTDQLPSLPFLEASILASILQSFFNCNVRSYLLVFYKANLLGNKVNYKPNLWHWPKTGSYFLPYFPYSLACPPGPILLSASAVEREQRLLTYLFQTLKKAPNIKRLALKIRLNN